MNRDMFFKRKNVLYCVNHTPTTVRDAVETRNQQIPVNFFSTKIKMELVAINFFAFIYKIP